MTITIPDTHRWKPPVTSAGRQPLERALVWALIAFVVSLSLEWVAFRGVAGGILKPFHVCGLFMAALCLARWRPVPFTMPLLRRHFGVFGAYFLSVAVVAAMGLFHVQPYQSGSQLVRQALYAAISVFVASLVPHLARGRVAGVLAWSGVAGVAVLLVGLSASVLVQGSNPLSLVGEALARRDPDVISYRLLRVAFRSQEEFAEVGANLRHKVFAAVLLAVFLGLALLPLARARRRATRVVLLAGPAIGMGMVVLSLSRSTMLCLGATLLLVPIRMIARRRARPEQMAVVLVAVGMVVAIAVSPVGKLVSARFGSTDSYRSRVAAAGPGFLTKLEGSAFVGAEKTDVERSPHNLVLQAWLSGGVLAAVCVFIMLLCYAHVWLREARRYISSNSGWNLPVHQVWVLGIGLIPLVRAFTAGNELHMVGWAGIGLFLGLTQANALAGVGRQGENGAGGALARV